MPKQPTSRSLIPAIESPLSTEYLESLRCSVIGHLDKVEFNIETLTKKQRTKFIDIYKQTYSNVSVNDYPHRAYKWEHGRFVRQSKIKVYPLRMLLDWKRDPKRQPFSPFSGRLRVTWDQKQDYTTYNDHLRQIEYIMTLCGLTHSLDYVELAQDTLSPSLGAYIFKHALLVRGRYNQIMWYDHVADKMKAGTNLQADNYYQNNEDSVKQLTCHQKTEKANPNKGIEADYFDEIMQGYIWRCELRIKTSIISRYATNVNEIIENQEKICDDHIQWRKIDAGRLRKVRMSKEKRSELENSFTIHAIYQLTREKRPYAVVRKQWTVPVEKLPCKYMT